MIYRKQKISCFVKVMPLKVGASSACNLFYTSYKLSYVIRFGQLITCVQKRGGCLTLVVTYQSVMLKT